MASLRILEVFYHNMSLSIVVFTSDSIAHTQPTQTLIITPVVKLSSL